MVYGEEVWFELCDDQRIWANILYKKSPLGYLIGNTFIFLVCAIQWQQQ